MSPRVSNAEQSRLVQHAQNASCPGEVPGIHVTPAKAGVQFFFARPRCWIPAYAGMSKARKEAGFEPGSKGFRPVFPSLTAPKAKL